MTQTLDVRDICAHLGIDKKHYLRYVIAQYKNAKTQQAKEAWLELLLTQIVEWTEENKRSD